MAAVAIAHPFPAVPVVRQSRAKKTGCKVCGDRKHRGPCTPDRGRPWLKDLEPVPGAPTRCRACGGPLSCDPIFASDARSYGVVRDRWWCLCGWDICWPRVDMIELRMKDRQG